MELKYVVDEAAGRIDAVAAGAIERDAFLEMLDRMRAEGTWSYATMLDIRAMTGLPTLDTLRDIARVASGPGPEGQHRGPLAIVTENPAHYGMARTYAALSSGRDVDVFSEPSDAALWLLMRTPQPGR
jgi:hypothetical protein